MLTIIVAVMIAISLACIVLMKARATDPAQLNQPRSALLTIGIQIICGDCAGDEWQPVKTYLDRFGNCSQCGGRSYVLASAVAASGALSRARKRDLQVAAGMGRVIPFELGSRTRSEKIAV
jgi:hypothetical protein